MSRTPSVLLRWAKPCFWGLCLWLWVLPGLAQSSSANPQDQEQQIIGDVRALIEKGQFRSAQKTLNETAFQSVQGKREARILQIKLYLVQDQLEAAADETRALLIAQPGYEPDYEDPAGYVDLIKEVRGQLASQTIASVSKIAERPEEAPATVYIVTQQEMRRRGYNDLIELLKDQPGFDILGFYSATYANIYQRGYRSTNTERTLLLIDGVEENDLYFNIPYISRQYPISNIERVEIIYGPTSTLYGPNAFVGVINVVTKRFSGTKKGNLTRPTGEVHAGAGSYQTYWADGSVGSTSKSGRVQWEVTGRVFWSEEMDLSTDPLAGEAFDYSLNEFDTTTRYDSILTISVDETITLDSLGLPSSHPYFTETVANGNRTISPTAEGIAAARAADATLYSNGVDNSPLNGFSNPSFDYYLRAQMRIDRLRITAQHWTRQEGTAARYRDMVVAPSNNGSLWTPQNFTFSVQYAAPLNDAGTWTFSSLTSYRYHRLQPQKSNLLFAQSYWRTSLNLVDLVSPDDPSTYADNVVWVNRLFFQEARQLRTEQKFVYAATEELSWVSGIEARNSQLQGDYIVTYDTINAMDATNCETWPNPQGCGVVSSNQELGGNQYSMWDLGLYSQAQWRPIDSLLKIVLGARVDYNQIRSDEGFGWAISPRIAAVFTPGPFVAKAIYARGIQNPSQWSRYSTGGTRVPTRTLEEEIINSYEVSLLYQQRNSQDQVLASIEGTAYLSDINNVVGLRTIAPGVTQNANIGTYSIFGVQINGRWNPLPYLGVWGNYSYTNGHVDRLNDSIESGEVDQGFAVDNKIADIAPHQIKAGVHGQFLQNRLQVNLRGQYVSPRPTGGGTTNPENDGEYNTPQGHFFRAYTLLYATLGWDFGSWISTKGLGQGLTAQVSFNNLLNTRHYNTGPLNGDGVTNPSLIPQRGFHTQFRILYNF